MECPTLETWVVIMFLFLPTSTAFNVTTLTFGQSYSPLFSDFNINRSADDTAVSLLLNRLSGNTAITASLSLFQHFFIFIHTYTQINQILLINYLWLIYGQAPASFHLIITTMVSSAPALRCPPNIPLALSLHST